MEPQLRARILDAAALGYDAALRSAINEATEAGWDPHSGYPAGLYGSQTPCLAAARNGQESCILTLVELGADVQQTDYYGRTLIYVAALYAREHIVRTLVSLGVDVNQARIDNGRGPCEIAAMAGNMSCLTALIELGADATAAANSGTLSNPANQNTRDLLTTTIARCVALQDAARDGNEDEVRVLIHEHTGMIHAGAHAADTAQANGHNVLAARLRELWTSVVRSGGYDRYNALQARRSRWLILRERFNTESARQSFTQATLSPQDRSLFDWLLVGTTTICPDDIFSVIMGFYG